MEPDFTSEQVINTDLAKEVVAHIAPNELPWFDSQVHRFFQFRIQPSQEPMHLGNDTTLYVLMAIQFLWPYLSSYIARFRETSRQNQESFQTLAKIKEKAKLLPVEVQGILRSKLRGYLDQKTLTEEESEEVTAAICNLLFSLSKDDYQKLLSKKQLPDPQTANNRIKVVILTPRPVEFEAILRHLGVHQHEMFRDEHWAVGNYEGLNHTFEILLRLTGAQIANITAKASQAISIHQPRIVALNGIAAGLKDARIGDIVVATEAYGYESVKITSKGVLTRPKVIPCDIRMLEWARLTASSTRWRDISAAFDPQCQVHFGPVASGDKLVASTDSDLYHYITTAYEDTTALEMEAIGFATAVHIHREVFSINVRGISDLIKEKSDEHQKMAADRAASFFFELLYHLRFNEDGETRPSQGPVNPTSIIIQQATNVIVGSHIESGGDVNITKS